MHCLLTPVRLPCGQSTPQEAAAAAARAKAEEVAKAAKAKAEELRRAREEAAAAAKAKAAELQKQKVRRAARAGCMFTYQPGAVHVCWQYPLHGGHGARRMPPTHQVRCF
jgi:sRNA-binding protein